MPSQHIKKNPGNQYVEHEWPLSWFDTVVVTSPHEVDENGAVIVPFPGPTRAEILELRALSNDKRYTQDDRQKFSQIADTMEGAMAERPELAGNGADDDYDAPGEPTSREDISPEFSEDRLALRFTDRHGKDLRYVDEWGKWLAWTDTHWDIEKTLLAPHRAREICREAASECNKPSESKAIVKWRTVNAVETMARSDRRIAAIINQWDADPSLLNMQKISIKLSTGVERPNNPLDYCTKITGAAAAPEGTPCPMWLSFLNTVMNGDADLIDYLQRVCGYCMTGSIKEHAMFFLYGTGANGKSVFINTLRGILGTYHTTAPIETFTVAHSTQHPTDLAGLRGARLVTAVETEEGRTWAESKLKAITGGDEISARFMRQDFFSFIPTFKLMIAGNHKPRLRSVDEAMRRRFHLIPFSVTIPPNKRDKDLAEKLKAEWPAILRWMVAGCLIWQRDGLNPPQAVIEATNKYLETEDSIGTWIEERCECKPSYKDTSANLFASWKTWAELNGEFVGSQKQFSEKLQGRGMESITIGDKKARGYQGLRTVKAEEQPTYGYRDDYR